MPIFEHDDEFNEEEIKRQQRALTEKIFRLQWKELIEAPSHEIEDSNGDCWIEEETEE